MARTNYSIGLGDPTNAVDLIDAAYNGNCYVGTNTDPVPTNTDSNIMDRHKGVYEMWVRYYTDSTESAQAVSPAREMLTSCAFPSRVFPTNITLTNSYIVNWSVNSPGLVQLTVLSNNRAFVKAIAPQLAGVSMGTLTATGTIDGVAFTKTINLITYIDTVTGIDVFVNQINSIDGSSCTLQQPQYSNNGGSTWLTFPPSGMYVPPNSSITFRGTFVRFNSDVRTIEIVTPWGNTTEWSNTTTQTLTTPTYTLGTSNVVINYKCY